MMVVTPTNGRPSIEHDSFANFAVAPRRRRRAGHQRHARHPGAALRAAEGGHEESDRVPAHARARSGDVGDVVPSGETREAGRRVTFSDALSAEVLEKEEGTVVIRFIGDMREIERLGIPPLPPYIARETPRESDKESYQTVYAAARGAIAAPTAGLHFTQEILDDDRRARRRDRARHAARRHRHVQTGEGRSHRRAPHGLRALRHHRRGRGPAQRRARGEATDRRRRHDQRAHARERDPRRRRPLRRRATARRRSSSRPASSSAPSTGC